jgi:hypothetical protein
MASLVGIAVSLLALLPAIRKPAQASPRRRTQTLATLGCLAFILGLVADAFGIAVTTTFAFAGYQPECFGQHGFQRCPEDYYWHGPVPVEALWLRVLVMPPFQETYCSMFPTACQAVDRVIAFGLENRLIDNPLAPGAYWRMVVAALFCSVLFSVGLAWIFTKPRPGAERLWLWWVVATGLGWSIGLSLARPMGGLAQRTLVWPVWGAAVGIMQWLVLRRRLAGARGWVLVSIAGWAAGGLMIEAALPATLAWAGNLVVNRGALDESLYWLTHVLVALVLGPLGAIPVGTLQWLFLRRRLARAGWWLLATGLGWSLGVFASRSWGGYWESAGSWWGIMTGVAIAWLLHAMPQSHHTAVDDG